MNRKIISLSIDDDTYDEYRKYCKTKGLILSRQIEIFMKKELDKIKEAAKA